MKPLSSQRPNAERKRLRGGTNYIGYHLTCEKFLQDEGGKPFVGARTLWRATRGVESRNVVSHLGFYLDDAREFLTAAGINADAIAPRVQERFIIAFVRV
jgi:hypothetical protein